MVVDDVAIMRTMVGTALENIGFEVVTTGTGAGAIAEVEHFDPDLLVCDLDLGSAPSGVDVIREVRRTFPWVGIVVLTAYRSPLLIGADVEPTEDLPYVEKSAVVDIAVLEQAVDAAMRHEQYRPSGDPPIGTITPTQAELLRLIAAGMSNPQIAELLGIERRSVEHACRRLYRALGISADSETNPRMLAAKALASGRIEVRHRSPSTP